MFQPITTSLPDSTSRLKKGEDLHFCDILRQISHEFFAQGTKGDLFVVDELLDLCLSQHCNFQFSAMSTQHAPDQPDPVPGTVYHEQRHGLEPESYTSRKLVCTCPLQWLLLSIDAKKTNHFLVS